MQGFSQTNTAVRRVLGDRCGRRHHQNGRDSQHPATAPLVPIHQHRIEVAEREPVGQRIDPARLDELGVPTLEVSAGNLSTLRVFPEPEKSPAREALHPIKIEVITPHGIGRRYREPKRAAAVLFTLHANPPLHLANQLAADRQAQTSSGLTPSGGAVDLEERLKQLGTGREAESAPGVVDLKPDLLLSGPQLLKTDKDTDLPLVCVLYGVTDEVNQHLVNPLGGALYAPRNVGFDKAGELEAVAMG